MNSLGLVAVFQRVVIRRFRTSVPVSVLTQSGPDLLGLDQDRIQVQITGCHKVITQEAYFNKRVTIEMVLFY